ncbi:hypothetical protein BH11ARM2_BH11ARM2_34000 [soil metagenome]
MSALVLRHVALENDGPTIALTLEAGHLLAVLGPSGGGKSHFLRSLAGEERFARGSYERGSGPLCAVGRVGGRTKPVSLAGQGGNATPTSITDALTSVGLWDLRNEAVGKLTPSHAAAAELLPAMVEGAGLRLVDGLYEALDPWAYASALERTRWLRDAGAAFVVATNRAELAREADAILVLRSGKVVFAGTPAELLRKSQPTRLTVEADGQAGVRAIAAPFSVDIHQEGGTLRMETSEGQALAARLLLEGYGNVRSVIVQEPDIVDSLRSL